MVAVEAAGELVSIRTHATKSRAPVPELPRSGVAPCSLPIYFIVNAVTDSVNKRPPGRPSRGNSDTLIVMLTRAEKLTLKQAALNASLAEGKLVSMSELARRALRKEVALMEQELAAAETQKGGSHAMGNEPTTRTKTKGTGSTPGGPPAS